MSNRSGGLVAANIALNPLQNIAKITKFYILGRLFQNPRFLRYLTYDLSQPNAMTDAQLTSAMSKIVSQTVARDPKMIIPGSGALDVEQPETGE